MVRTCIHLLPKNIVTQGFLGNITAYYPVGGGTNTSIHASSHILGPAIQSGPSTTFSPIGALRAPGTTGTNLVATVPRLGIASDEFKMDLNDVGPVNGMADYIPYYDNQGKFAQTIYIILNSLCVAGRIIAYHQPAPRQQIAMGRHGEAGVGRLDGTGANIN